ncbi:MAG TPA: sodium:solute symporter [Hyphomicrobiaceae bacterium]|nr:sodium:solute symporter [Hyphomicrobiaceae bacterium]
MAATSRAGLVNPLLGTYFGIFTATLVSLVLMALMLEQLGVSDPTIRLLMFGGPIVLYVGIGGVVWTRDAPDYFACGRRVPAFFNGLVLAIGALGGAGFLALTGTFFVVGYDALCLSLGFCAGLVFMGILLAPFLRKSGDYTVPSYLSRRFDNRLLRIVAAAVQAVPLLLLLAAEARFASYASARLTGQPDALMAVVVVICAAATVLAGGMRSQTWSSSAKAIAALVALAVPATIVALMLTNLPLPQITHGNSMRVLTRMEEAHGLPLLTAPPLVYDFPGQGVEPLAKRFITAFGGIGSLAFVLLALITAAGIAGSPALLARPGSTPGVHESRKSFGWAVLIAGVVLLTLPAVAVYLRTFLLEQVVDQPVNQLPAWFQMLVDNGTAYVDSTSKARFVSLSFERDAVLFALSQAAGFPQVLVYLALAGALAAALVALSSALMTSAAMVSEDIVHGLRAEPVADATRITAARIALGGVTLVTVWIAAVAPADPLRLFLWSLCYSAACVFPVLLLSIWWKRCTAWGAIAGLLAGLAATTAAILLGESGTWALPSVLAGAVGLPISVAATIGTSVLTPRPSRHVIDILQEIRVPGGETLYDRELRLQRLKTRPVT